MSIAAVRRVLVAATSLLVRSAASAQTPTHSYSLNGTYADALGGPAIEGNGGTVGPMGYTFGQNQGLTLRGALNTSVYSVEFVFALNGDPTFSYWKLVDFTNLTEDRGLYNSLGYAELFPDAISSSPRFAANQPAQLVITRDASNLFSAYVNGTLAFSLTDNDAATVFPTVGGQSVGHFLMDDATTAGVESTSGFVDYLRTYDRALTSDEVAGLYTPDQWTIPQAPNPNWCATPEPATLALTAGGGLLLVGFARRRRTA